MALEKVIELHPLGGTVVKLKHVETVEPKKLSKNQKKKLLKGYYSKEKHVAMLTSIMNGKHYNRKANNKKGILPSQMGTIRKSIYKLNPETLAHIIREQEKRTQAI
mgnify:CR=1 FL=1|jgi:hypothetical protein